MRPSATGTLLCQQICVPILRQRVEMEKPILPFVPYVLSGSSGPPQAPVLLQLGRLDPRWHDLLRHINRGSQVSGMFDRTSPQKGIIWSATELHSGFGPGKLFCFRGSPAYRCSFPCAKVKNHGVAAAAKRRRHFFTGQLHTENCTFSVFEGFRASPRIFDPTREDLSGARSPADCSVLRSPSLQQLPCIGR